MKGESANEIELKEKFIFLALFTAKTQVELEIISQFFEEHIKRRDLSLKGLKSKGFMAYRLK